MNALFGYVQFHGLEGTGPLTHPARYHSGMGFSLLSFDWNQIAFIGSPLATPCMPYPVRTFCSPLTDVRTRQQGGRKRTSSQASSYFTVSENLPLTDRPGS